MGNYLFLIIQIIQQKSKMRFVYYTSLIASVFAIRIQTHTQSHAAAQVKIDALGQSLVQAGMEILMKDRHKDMAQWFIDEIHSVEGLTWEEFKYHMGAIATEHNYQPTSEDWSKIKEIFDSVVGLQFNPTIHP